MKKIAVLMTLLFAITSTLQAQDMKKDAMAKTESNIQVIQLEQTPGEFTQKKVTVAAGTYVFEIKNNAGKDVGFVLVPKGKDISDPNNHIKTAYVTDLVKDKTTGNSNKTKLAKGEYVYFCPLNETATNNTLIVQ